MDEFEVRSKLILKGATWDEILTSEEKSRMDAYDVTILECIRKRFKRGVPMPMDMDMIRRDVHLEMGGLTNEKFQEKVKKLEDMALLRRYVTLNI